MRRLSIRIAALLFAVPALAAELGDDGLHKAGWMRDTFKDLRDDLAEANSEGKRLMIIFEQRGCIYCTRIHEEVFSLPLVDGYIRDNYFVLQMDLYGATEITDLDGEVLSERDAARKWRVMFTPTILFLPEEVPEGRSAADAAVAAIPGAFGAGTTLDLLTWVREKRYAGENAEDFQRYHDRRIGERDSDPGG